MGHRGRGAAKLQGLLCQLVNGVLWCVVRGISVRRELASARFGEGVELPLK